MSAPRYEVSWDCRDVAPWLSLLTPNGVLVIGSGALDGAPCRTGEADPVEQAALCSRVSQRLGSLAPHVRWPGGALTQAVGAELEAMIGDRAAAVLPVTEWTAPSRGAYINERGGV